MRVTSSIHCRCGHCEKFAPVWEELETYYNSDITVDIGKVRERAKKVWFEQEKKRGE